MFTPEDREHKGQRTSVPAPILIVGAIVLLVTLGWAYFVGFLVGRGEDPQAKWESLLSFEKKEKPSIPSQENPKKPEELLPPVQEPIKSETKPDAHPFVRPSEQNRAAWEKNLREQPKGSVETKKPDPPQRQEKKPEPPQKQEPRYEVVYQVATFPSLQDAENFRKQWNGRGIEFRVQKLGKHYRVVANYKGTLRDARQMKAKFSGIKKWLVISSQKIEEGKTQGRQKKSEKPR